MIGSSLVRIHEHEPVRIGAIPGRECPRHPRTARSGRDGPHVTVDPQDGGGGRVEHGHRADIGDAAWPTAQEPATSSAPAELRRAPCNSKCAKRKRTFKPTASIPSTSKPRNAPYGSAPLRLDRMERTNRQFPCRRVATTEFSTAFQGREPHGTTENPGLSAINVDACEWAIQAPWSPSALRRSQILAAGRPRYLDSDQISVLADLKNSLPGPSSPALLPVAKRRGEGSRKLFRAAIRR